MTTKTVLIALSILATSIFAAAPPIYKMIHQRAELLNWDADSISEPPEFHFGKINRTTFALNTSFTLMRDFSDNKVSITLYIDKLFGTEYKRTGTKITSNLCKMWSKNFFLMKERISERGNLTACNVAPAHYYLRDFTPTADQFPRYLPYGSYRVEILVDSVAEDYKRNLFDMYWFAKVEQIPK